MNHDDLREAVNELTTVSEKVSELLNAHLPGVSAQVIEDHVWANVQAAAFSAFTIIDAHEQDIQGDPHDHNADCYHCPVCGRRPMKTIPGQQVCIYAHDDALSELERHAT